MVLAALASALLAACQGKQVANEQNFGAAMTAYLAKKGELCLGLYDWTVGVGSMDRHSVRAGQLAALERAGLVQAREAEVEEKLLLGGVLKRRILRYEPTAEGRKFYREREVLVLGPAKALRGDLCYGQRVLNRIVRWDQPISLGEYKEVSLTYTYRVDQLAEWATNPEVQRAFPAVAQEVSGAGKSERRHALKLTNQGWEALGPL
jgi:hypothetical protein